MTEESGMTAKETEAPKKRGPKSRADIEAEVRAQIEAEARADIEQRLREEIREEVQAKARKDELARAAASEAKPVSGFDISGDPTAEGAVTFHFVDDGFTLLGKVWYRGEELTVVEGSPQWEEAMAELPPKGSGNMKPCFLFDEFEQEEKWGRRFFRMGPWRGKRLDEIDDESLTEAERAQLVKAQRLREERYGAVLR